MVLPCGVIIVSVGHMTPRAAGLQNAAERQRNQSKYQILFLRIIIFLYFIYHSAELGQWGNTCLLRSPLLLILGSFPVDNP